MKITQLLEGLISWRGWSSRLPPTDSTGVHDCFWNSSKNRYTSSASSSQSSVRRCQPWLMALGLLLPPVGATAVITWYGTTFRSLNGRPLPDQSNGGDDFWVSRSTATASTRAKAQKSRKQWLISFETCMESCSRGMAKNNLRVYRLLQLLRHTQRPNSLAAVAHYL